MESKRVLIVARTVAFDGLCVGAVTSRKWEALRLLPPGRNRFWAPAEAPVKGGIYDIKFQRPTADPPHNEDARLVELTKVGIVRDLAEDVRKSAPIHDGPLEEQFEGHLTSPPGKGHSLAIMRPNLPSFSTQFWRTNEPLVRNDDIWEGSTKIRFETSSGIRMPWKSDEDPPSSIEAGQVVRLSLAGWWQDACFLQLSDAYQT